MSAKSIAAQLPNFAEASPLAKNLRNGARWLLRGFTPAAACSERALAVEERVAIGPKKSLVVVRCHGQRFLVGTAGDAIGPVIEIRPSKKNASPGSPHKPAPRARKEREA